MDGCILKMPLRSKTELETLFFHRQFSSTIHRPFTIRYDPITSSLDVLDRPGKIQKALGQMQEELKTLYQALENLTQK